MRSIAILLALSVGAAAVAAQGPKTTARRPGSAQLALQIADFAALPMTGSPTGAGNNAGSLARINVMREESAPSRRFFVNDLNGPLYILDRTTKNASIYLDFNGRGVMRGLFDRSSRIARPPSPRLRRAKPVWQANH